MLRRSTGSRQPSPDYRALVEHLIDPVLILNRQGKICFTNHAAERLLGDALKKRLEVHLNRRPKQTAVSQAKFLLDSGAYLVLKIRLSHVEWVGQPAVLVALHDVTPHIEAAQRIRDRHLRSLSLLECVPAASYVVAPGGRASAPFISRQFQDLLGYPCESWREDAELWRRFIHHDDRNAVHRHLTESIKTGDPFTAEYRMVTQSGDLIWVREEARVVKDQGTELLLLSGFLIDITDKKRAEEELNSLRRELEELAKGHTGELAKVKAQLRQELAERKQTEEQHEKLRQEMSQSERIVEQLKAERDDFERRTKERVDELRRVNTELRHELAETQQVMKRLEAERDELEGRAREKANGIVKAHERLESEMSERERVQKESEQLRKELSESRLLAEKLKADHDDLEERSKRHAGELEKTREQVQQAISERKTTQDENTKLRQEIADVRRAVQKLKAQRDQLEQQLKESTAELQNAKEPVPQEMPDRERPQEEPTAGREKPEGIGRLFSAALEKGRARQREGQAEQGPPKN